MTHRRTVLEAAGSLLLMPLLPARLLARRASSIRRQRVFSVVGRCAFEALVPFGTAAVSEGAALLDRLPSKRLSASARYKKNAAELPLTLRGRSWSWHRAIGRADPTLDGAPTRPGSTFLGGRGEPSGYRVRRADTF